MQLNKREEGPDRAHAIQMEKKKENNNPAQILYENRYKVTRERYLDWAKHPVIKSGRTILEISWIVLMAVFLITTVIMVIGDRLWTALLYGVLAVFSFYRAFLRTKMLASRQFQILAGVQGGQEWTRVIRFYEDCITTADGNTTTQYRYDTITGIVEKRGYLSIVFGRVCIRMDRNGFCRGTEKEVKEFLERKMAEAGNPQAN
ncbi:YcxB family protein [Anaerolentibacter hominis]|uniref:YcxB family protein n=1 Tax=Anaerolentibacter hominis TaxID=3079009 RepID=UPI0031B851F5